MTIVCNIWMISLRLELNFWICIDATFFSMSRFILINFLLIEVSIVVNEQNRLYPLSFFANTPFKLSRKKSLRMLPITFFKTKTKNKCFTVQKWTCLGLQNSSVNLPPQSQNILFESHIDLFCQSFKTWVDLIFSQRLGLWFYLTNVLNFLVVLDINILKQ